MLKLILISLISMNTLASSIEFTYYLKAKHPSGEYKEYGKYHKLNEDQNFLGVEYRDGNKGYSISAFKNSFRKDSVMIDRAWYMPVTTNIEASYRAGLVTGYSKGDFCIINGAKLCPIITASLSYTKYSMVIPRITLMGDAVALSFSARF